MTTGLSKLAGHLKQYWDRSRDNFDRDVANPLLDLIDVAGEKEFTPERLRYFKDGNRRYLQYGTDANYTETQAGHLLQPDSDMTLTLRTAEKAAYQVGFDLWPTQSYQGNGTLQTGDVIGAGYGVIDLANFDATAVDPSADNPASNAYTGNTADGYFFYHTEDTGFGNVLLALVQAGTVTDSEIVERARDGDVFSIVEQQLNCYAVGPSVFRETFTDKTQYPKDPQVNRVMGAVSNDDGQGSADFSHRMIWSIHQAAGNTGLELEAGSVAMRTPGTAEPQFKSKGNSMDLDNTNTTEGTYQALGAMRIDPTRTNAKLRFTDMTIIATPGNSTNRTRVILQSVDPEHTNADTKNFVTPVEHSTKNSILQEVEVAGDANTPLTGPIEDDVNTNVDGAAVSNTTTNPGGYQLIRASLTPEGGGTSTGVTAIAVEGNRELYPGDICLVYVDSNTAGVHEIDVSTEQNS